MKVVAIGASAGGVEALRTIVRALPADFPAAVLVVVHFPPESPSVLPAILDRAGAMPAVRAEEGMVLEPGRIYVAQPGRHLLVDGDRLVVSMGPKENGYRPAVDPLFRSVAQSCDGRGVGVILSGNLADGSAGLAAIKRRGGIAVVQDPDDAIFAGMPRNALNAVAADYVVPLSSIATTLLEIANSPDEAPRTLSPEAIMDDETLRYENDVARNGVTAEDIPRKPGRLAGYGCPDCGGTLWELAEGEVMRFRCRVGHAWAAENLLAEQSHGVESALWTALRALEENAQLSRQLADRMSGKGHGRSAEAFTNRAVETERSAQLLRRVLIEERSFLNEALVDVTDSLESSGKAD